MITPEQYQQFLTSIVSELDGDWVIIGGSLLAIINAESRVTSDIDLCSIDELTNDKRISLMKIAQASGLSVEAINPAADFFLKQIPHWKQSLVLLQAGSRGNLYRPSLKLYIELKLSRSSSTDLIDCISFLKWHLNNNINFNYLEFKSYLVDQAVKNPKINEIIDVLDRKNS